MLDDLAGKAHVILRPGGDDVVENDRLAVPRRLGEAHIPGDGGLVDLIAEVGPYLVGDLARQIQAAVVHGQQYTGDLQLFVQMPLDEPDRVEQLAQTLQGVVFALNGDEDGVGRRQGIECQQAQRRRAVEDDILVVSAHVPKDVMQLLFAGDHVHHLHLGPRQVDV